MQQPEPKVTAELTKSELDAVLRERIKQQQTKTAREAFRALSATEQRNVLRKIGVRL